MIVQGVISRELIIEYFDHLFIIYLQEEFLDNEDSSYFLSDLVINSGEIYPEELQAHIDRAFELDLIDPFFINRKDIEYYLGLGKNAALAKLKDNSYYSPIEDTVSEMEYWACFQDFKLVRKKPAGLGTLKPTAKKKSQKQARRKNRSKKK